MTALGWQITGMMILLGTILGGYRIWRRGLDHPPGRAGTLAACVLLATFGGGFWGAFAWWPNYPEAFSWALPGLGAKMLAAAGWSFALASVLALARPVPAHLRMVLLMLWAYLGPLSLAIVTAHLDRFDFTRPVTIAFFAIVLALLVASSLALIGLPGAAGRVPEPPGRLTELALRVIAAVSGLWAALLFLLPDGPSAVIWPWPGDALTTRLIASMFLSIAIGAWAARSDRVPARTALWTTIAYGIGVLAAGIAHVMTEVPSEKGYAKLSLPLSYMVVWGGLGLVAALALASLRPGRDRA